MEKNDQNYNLMKLFIARLIFMISCFVSMVFVVAGVIAFINEENDLIITLLICLLVLTIFSISALISLIKKEETCKETVTSKSADTTYECKSKVTINSKIE